MEKYVSALGRYASEEMNKVFSNNTKFSTWRKCWIALAEAQKEIGLQITQEQIDELKKNQYNIDYKRAAELEKQLKHDVMAHVHLYGEQCPKAKGIIHLGATSMLVCDNTELIQIRDGLDIIINKTAKVIGLLSNFAKKYKDMPALGYTHFQPAQPVTVGKRTITWAYDFVLALERLEYEKNNLKARGIKGATGTNASFLDLLDGDRTKLKELNEKFCNKIGFDDWYKVTGQTYPRIIDTFVLSILGATSAAASKFGNDLRLLAHEKEIEEPFGKKQIGSSAMPYKRNPMKAERINALARHAFTLSTEALATQASQWLERTLDDSACRRFYLPETFLSLDGILNIYSAAANGLVVYPKMIEKNLMEEFPFMVTEKLLMRAVENGGDRQELHEVIRDLSQKVGDEIKKQAIANNLLDLLKKDKKLNKYLKKKDFDKLTDPKNFIGDCIEQVEEFNKDIVKPILDKYKPDLGDVGDLKV